MEALIDDQAAHARTITADQFRAMTFPERAAYYADQLTADAAAMRARANAARHFYQMLTPDQRTEFDEAAAPKPQAEPHVAPDTRPLPPGPPPSNFTSPARTDPSWLVKPTADNISRVYPLAALRKRLNGEVLLQCTVDYDGYLFDCVVRQETPPDEGFGNAALEITAYMRMKPATKLGVPTASSVEVPVHFSLQARAN